MLPSRLVVLHYAAQIVIHVQRGGVDDLAELGLGSRDNGVQAHQRDHGVGSAAQDVGGEEEQGAGVHGEDYVEGAVDASETVC